MSETKPSNPSTSTDAARALDQELEFINKMEEAKKNEEYRRALRTANAATAVAQTRKDVAQGKISLKSDVKKSTALVKKLRNLSEDMRASMRKDVTELNLKRYVSEIVAAICEAKLRTADIPAAVEICSLMHQRYADFTEPLMQSLLSAFEQQAAPGSPEEKALMTRKRSTLRLLTELFYAGVFTDIGIIIKIIRGMCQPFEKQTNESGKREGQTASASLDVPLLVSFAKYAGEDLLGVTSRKQRQVLESAAGHSCSFEREKLVDENVQKELLSLLTGACRHICDLLVLSHKSLRRLEKRNAREELNRGELSEESQQRHEAEKKSYEKLLSNATSLTDALNLDMPELPEEQPETVGESGTISLFSLSEKERKGEGGLLDGPFEDEEARSFYRDLPNLLDMVPYTVLGLSEAEYQALREKLSNSDPNAVDNMKEEEEEGAGEVDPSSASSSVSGGETDAESVSSEDDTTASGKPSEAETAEVPSLDLQEESAEEKRTVHFDLFLEKLEELVNRDKCDQCAVDFCYINNKGTRKRLVRALYSVPRSRLELIPHYARLTATLNTIFPEIGASLVELLMGEFLGLQRNKSQNRLETKIKNIRFLGELTKFRIVPPNTAFRCLKRCFDDFTGHNIDVATTMLETCGRYLYRTPHTHSRCANFIEIMMRLKQAKNLDNRAETMIQNAYYMCKPSERTGWKIKEHPPLYLYIMKVLYSDLEENNVEDIIKTLRTLPWQEKETTEYFVKCVMKVTKSKYMKLHLVCDCLAGLSKYQDHLGIRVVDGTLEEIRQGLVLNDYRDQQLRIGYIKLFGELYNYSLVTSQLIIDQLHLLINHGHDLLDYYQQQLPPGQKLDPEYEKQLRLFPNAPSMSFRYDPRVPTPLDGPEDMFRIRLVCTLLEVVGHYFDQGTPREKMNRFLIFFQRYILSKPFLPTETEFAVLDILDSLRPEGEKGGLRRFQNWEEAQEEVAKIQQKELETALEEERKKDAARRGRERKPGEGQAEVAAPPSPVGSTGSSANDFDEEDDGEDGEQRDSVTGGEEGEEDEDEEAGEDEEGGFGDDDAVVVLDHRVKEEEDEDFEREFKAMMQESVESRKLTRVTNADNMALPVMYKGGIGARAAADAPKEDPEEAPEDAVKFRLLKRGTRGKVEAKTLFVPQNTSLAHHSIQQENAERAEQSELKRLVLSYEAREDGYNDLSQPRTNTYRVHGGMSSRRYRGHRS